VFNTLIKKSQYDIISIFGADDIMKNTHLEYNLKLMNDNIFIKTMGVNFSKSISEVITKPTGSNYCGIIIFNKKDFFKVNGYADWMCGADSDINRRLSLYGIKVIKSANVTYYRRIHNDSLTKNELYGQQSVYRRDIKNKISQRTKTKKIINDNYVIFQNNKQIN
jgi:hypothetical protein